MMPAADECRGPRLPTKYIEKKLRSSNQKKVPGYSGLYDHVIYNGTFQQKGTVRKWESRSMRYNDFMRYSYCNVRNWQTRAFSINLKHSPKAKFKIFLTGRLSYFSFALQFLDKDNGIKYIRGFTYM